MIVGGLQRGGDALGEVGGMTRRHGAGAGYQFGAAGHDPQKAIGQPVAQIHAGEQFLEFVAGDMSDHA